jgi:hypothetical protein
MIKTKQPISIILMFGVSALGFAIAGLIAGATMIGCVLFIIAILFLGLASLLM